MKLLLIGHAGSLGSTILRQCLSDRAITSLIILTLLPLTPQIATSDERIKVIIVDSFTVYDGDVLQELEGAVGCLWYTVLFVITGAFHGP